jgi:hypothetical protein
MSFTWPNANSEERKLLQAITVLLGYDQKLLIFLLDPDSPRLRRRAGILKEDSWRLSESQQLQIRAALDLWSGSGHLQLWEILEKWDDGCWQNFLGAIRIRVGLDVTGEG